MFVRHSCFYNLDDCQLWCFVYDLLIVERWVRLFTNIPLKRVLPLWYFASAQWWKLVVLFGGFNFHCEPHLCCHSMPSFIGANFCCCCFWFFLFFIVIIFFFFFSIIVVIIIIIIVFHSLAIDYFFVYGQLKAQIKKRWWP